MISLLDEIKRRIAAKKENCWGKIWKVFISNIGVKIIFGLRFFKGTPLLVILHIPRTQKWAAPFPRSNTKSKISFSRGWAQEGLHSPSRYGVI